MLCSGLVKTEQSIVLDDKDKLDQPQQKLVSYIREQISSSQTALTVHSSPCSYALGNPDLGQENVQNTTISEDVAIYPIKTHTK